MTKRVTTAALAAPATVTVFTAAMPASQAAVSNAVRDDCARKANAVTPQLRAGEREAYITDCIADATVTPGKVKKKED